MTPAPDLAELRDVVVDGLEALLTIGRACGERELVRSTRCEGWRVADLLVHLRLNAEALLYGFAAPTSAAPDIDLRSYWARQPDPGSAGFTSVRWTWAVASSYPTADGLLRHFDDGLRAAVGVVTATSEGSVVFQGHVMSVSDLLLGSVLEHTIHHLDLLVASPEWPRPPAAAIELTRRVLAEIGGSEGLGQWDPETFVLKASGRLQLTDDERSTLGAAVRDFPALR